jgi:hypothetical protein
MSVIIGLPFAAAPIVGVGFVNLTWEGFVETGPAVTCAAVRFVETGPLKERRSIPFCQC